MGTRVIDLTGERFGMLKVERSAAETERRVGSNWNNRRQWFCVCDCGNTHVTTSSVLVNGETKSCGCYKISGRGRITHGHKRLGSTTRAYNAWCNMKSRCDDENVPQYKDWGGRGIKYCDRWKAFSNFLLDMGEPEKELSLDRENNDGNYEPSNCRWATKTEQRLNQRGTADLMISWNGEIHTTSDWERKLGFVKGVLRSRIWRGHAINERTMNPKLQRK